MGNGWTKCKSAAGVENREMVIMVAGGMRIDTQCGDNHLLDLLEEPLARTLYFSSLQDEGLDEGTSAVGRLCECARVDRRTGGTVMKPPA